MMDGEAVEAIGGYAQAALEARTHITTVDGRGPFSTVPLHRVPKEPESEPRALTVSTLESVATYLTTNRDMLSLDETTVHVSGPSLVAVHSALVGDLQQRMTYLLAVARPAAVTASLGFRFGEYLPLETMTIALQALFVAAHDRTTVLRLLGNVRNDEIGTLQDDGVTQQVSVRAGVSLVDRQSVPNPVTLAPFRTFAEVEQPASPFVLRVREKGREIEAALFEADGGAWAGVATASIAAWLRERLPAEVVILS